jgi:hypothetical protein
VATTLAEEIMRRITNAVTTENTEADSADRDTAPNPPRRSVDEPVPNVGPNDPHVNSGTHKRSTDDVIERIMALLDAEDAHQAASSTTQRENPMTGAGPPRTPSDGSLDCTHPPGTGHSSSAISAADRDDPRPDIDPRIQKTLNIFKGVAREVGRQRREVKGAEDNNEAIRQPREERATMDDDRRRDTIFANGRRAALATFISRSDTTVAVRSAGHDR